MGRTCSIVERICFTKHYTLCIDSCMEPYVVLLKHAHTHRYTNHSAKVAAESTTSPHLRQPPLRNNPSMPGGAHYRRLLHGVLLSRYPSDTPFDEVEIHPGDCFCVNDGGKHGNQNALMSVFSHSDGKSMEKALKTLYLHLNEEHAAKRRDITRGSLSLDITENYHLVSRYQLQTIKRPRLNFKGLSTASTGIAPVPMPSLTDTTETWQMTVADKKKVYPQCARILPGGPTPGTTADSNKAVPHVRKDTDIEPVTFHGPDYKLIEDLFHQVGSKGHIKGVIDLTSTEDTVALVCLNWKIPLLAFVFSDWHGQQLKLRIQQKLFMKSTQYMNGKNPLYNPALAAVLNPKVAADLGADGHEKGGNIQGAATAASAAATTVTGSADGEHVEEPKAKRSKKEASGKTLEMRNAMLSALGHGDKSAEPADS